jgi:hypothetical protein
MKCLLNRDLHGKLFAWNEYYHSACFNFLNISFLFRSVQVIIKVNVCADIYPMMVFVFVLYELDREQMTQLQRH